MGIRILVPRPRRSGATRPLRKIIWAALAIAIFGTAYTLLSDSGLVGVYRAQAQEQALAERVEQARAANRELEEQIRQMETDPEAIERLAREELYLAKPGERVYLLPPAPDTTPETAESRPPGPR